jgi:hypothetical protein
MDYTKIIEELEKASLLELYRLQSVISDEIDNPTKIKEVKNLLKEGQIVSYFSHKLNRFNRAEIITLNKKNCIIKELNNDNLWSTSYASINIDDIDITINAKQEYGLKKYQIAIGDVLTFLDNDNRQIYGNVIRLNKKTVTLKVDDTQWRVSYSLLSKNIDIDAEIINNNLLVIEHH